MHAHVRMGWLVCANAIIIRHLPFAKCGDDKNKQSDARVMRQSINTIIYLLDSFLQIVPSLVASWKTEATAPMWQWPADRSRRDQQQRGRRRDPQLWKVASMGQRAYSSTTNEAAGEAPCLRHDEDGWRTVTTKKITFSTQVGLIVSHHTSPHCSEH